MKATELYRTVFRCTDSDCRFIFSQLGAQAKFEIEGQCPACGEDIDYAPTSVIETYIKKLKDELQYVVTESGPPSPISMIDKREGVSVGDLLNYLKSFDDRQEISFENGAYLDGTFDSYRGYYEDLGLGFSALYAGYNTVGRLRAILTAALGIGTMEGWKGGEYPVTENTLVWLANEGTTKDSIQVRGVTVSYDYPDPVNIITRITINLGEYRGEKK